MKKLFLFKKVNNWGNKTFTHYWNNEGQEYYDSVKQVVDGQGHTYESSTLNFQSAYDELSKGPTEFYLEPYKAAGYQWVELVSTRIQRKEAYTLTLTLTPEEFQDNPILYFKLVDWDEESNTMIGLPFYYYSDKITEVSDQNFNTTAYSVVCSLDFWATSWVYFHTFMKDCPTPLPFMHKMDNRFIFYDHENWLKEHTQKQGFWIDYLKQPYLMRTNQYGSNLICDNRRGETFLSLDEWLFINSGKKDEKYTKNQFLQEVWIPWLQNQWCSYFSPNGDTYKTGISGIWASDNTSETTVLKLLDVDLSVENYYKKVSRLATPIRNNDFLDANYNSHSKYRYLVCKIGNNTWPATNAEGVTPTKPKETMFGQNSYFTYGVKKKDAEELKPLTTFDTNPWTRLDEKEFYKEIKISASTAKVGLSELMVAFENFIVNEKNIGIRVDYKNDEGIVINTSDVYFLDGLDTKLNYNFIRGVQANTFYDLATISSKSVIYNIDGTFSNAKIRVGVIFKETDGIYLGMKLTLDSDIEGLEWDKVSVSLKEIPTINTGTMFSEVEPDPQGGSEEAINGEALILMPFKKGEDEIKIIEKLNKTDYKIIMGNGSVLGMVVNDIPPSVLAMALRRYNDKNVYQTFGDKMSSRTSSAEGISYCPIDIVNLSLSSHEGTPEGKTAKENLSDYELPSIFTQFDSIPICVASSPSIEGPFDVIGGNAFFNYLYAILTDNDRTMVNTYEVEPLLYGPAFWKWAYYIDGNHRIELTADMIDLQKMITKSWDVYLNTSISDSTNFYLDITEIKNTAYPMTKVGMEFISADQSAFPFTTEAYQNWLQNNRWAQATTKELKDIRNEYAKYGANINAGFGGAGTFLQSMGSGLVKGGLPGLAIGAATGALAGGAFAGGTLWGVNNAIEEANKSWETRWQGMLGNLYSSPSTIVSGGFASGSLVYSPNQKAIQTSYELFRTFEIPELMKKYIWDDISINGYLWMSQCKYSEYNNRRNFNVVETNLTEKSNEVINYLKQRMYEYSPVLAQNENILAFAEKCRNLIRLYKVDIADSSVEEIIEDNIELEREWYTPYYGEATQWIQETDISTTENQSEWESAGETWNTMYEATWDDQLKNTLVSAKLETITPTVITIPYTKFGYGLDSFAAIKNAYKGIKLICTGSNFDVKVLLGTELQDYIKKTNNKAYNEEVLAIFDLLGETPKFEKYVNMKDSATIGKILFAQKDTIYESYKVENGYWLKLEVLKDAEGKETPQKLQLTVKPFNIFYFTEDVSDGWTFSDNTAELTKTFPQGSLYKASEFKFEASSPYSYYNHITSGHTIHDMNVDLYSFGELNFKLSKLAPELGGQYKEHLSAPTDINSNPKENKYYTERSWMQSLTFSDPDLSKAKLLIGDLTAEEITSCEFDVNITNETSFLYYMNKQSNSDEIREQSLNLTHPELNEIFNTSISVKFKPTEKDLETVRSAGTKVIKQATHNRKTTIGTLPKSEAGSSDVLLDLSDTSIDNAAYADIFIDCYRSEEGKLLYNIKYLYRVLTTAVCSTRVSKAESVWHWSRLANDYRTHIVRWAVPNIMNNTGTIKITPDENKALKFNELNKLNGIAFIRKYNEK